MYSGLNLPPKAAPGQKEVKPVLQGVRNKQRKGVTKANAKFEPQAFRDQLIKQLETVPAGDYESVAQKLDALGNQLDYRKYEQQLFEILLVGGLLAPGGSFMDDGAAKSTFSVLGSSKEPAEVPDMKKIVEVFNKLMRRYKYLQKPFEETVLRAILQYANKFSAEDQDKLAVATALFVTSDLTSASVLTSLKKEHLVKDGTALRFFTLFCKSVLQIETVDQLSSALRRGGMTDLESLFPAAKQNGPDLTAHFKGAGLGGVVEFWQKQRSSAAKEDLVLRLKELIAEEADQEEILAYLTAQHKKAVLPEADFISLVWEGLSTAVDMNAKPELINDLAVKEIASLTDLLEPFAQKPATEVALINTIQIWCYENTKLMPSFPKLLKLLYSKDVLSDTSIIYWHSKGSKTQARQHFLKATEPLVQFLKEDEEDEDDDE